MTPSLALGVAAAFVIVLLLLRTRNEEEAEDRAIAKGNQGIQYRPVNALQPAGLATRIFSQKDREFIGLTRSPRLRRLYLEERRKVALHWVRRTSREVNQIMHNHRLSSRQSVNLDVTAEVKLFLQYLELRFLCGMLLLLIQLFGPHALVNLAAHAGELYQQIGTALPDVGPAVRVASPGNIAAS
jgi:hypothetical protein